MNIIQHHSQCLSLCQLTRHCSALVVSHQAAISRVLARPWRLPLLAISGPDSRSRGCCSAASDSDGEHQSAADRAIQRIEEARLTSASNQNARGTEAMLSLQGHYFDAFYVLGISRSFLVDQTAVDQQYKSLQRLLHPDKYVLSSADEQKKAAEASAIVNTSVAIIRDVLRRAKHLIKIHELEKGNGNDIRMKDSFGGSMDSEDDEEEKVEDMDLLMKVMERREEVEEAESITNAKKRAEQLTELSKRNTYETNECTERLQSLFMSHEESEPLENEKKKLVQELTYLRRIKDEIERCLENEVS